MGSEQRTNQKTLTESEQMKITDDIQELKRRVREDQMVGDLLWEAEEERGSKRKLKELRNLLCNVQTQVEKAEHLLKEVIRDREEEDRSIEDAILLSDGVRKVQEQEEEKETEG